MRNQQPSHFQNNPFQYQQSYQQTPFINQKIPLKVQYQNPHRQQIFEDYKIKPPNNLTQNFQFQQQPNYSQIQNSQIKLSYKPKGLVNIGNNCYMNSILQMLFSIKPFRNAVITQLQSVNKNGKENVITDKLKQLFIKMNTLKQDYVEPNNFYYKFIEQHNTFGFGQEDAHEFLITLFQTLGNENQNIQAQESGIIDGMINFFDNLFQSKTQVPLSIDQAWIKNRKIENNIITDYFVGMFMNVIRCKNCDFTQQLFEEFNAISLDFGYMIGIRIEYQESCQLNELIQYQFKHQIISNYKCQRCKKEEHSMIQKIAKLPQILIFQLKRFNFQYQAARINTKIIFPLERLNLGEQCIQMQKEIYYDLQTIIHHTGDCNHGHYYATCQYEIDNKKYWFRIDDSLVEEAQIEKRQYDTFGTPTPYMLIYKQRQLF